MSKRNIHNGPRILVVANQKGGVGKTTTAVNMATALAAVGRRVLLCDLDPQGNASTGLGVSRQNRHNGSYDLIFSGGDVTKLAKTTRVPLLEVVPSSIHLSGAEIELVNLPERETRLRGALRREDLVYDYVVIDCPPSLNLLTLNAFVAAHSVVIPLQCEFYALEGLRFLMKTIARVRRSLNPELDIHGILLTMFDKRNSLSHAVASDVREYFGDLVYKTVIPRNVRISEAPSHGLPALVYDMRCPGSQGYIQLASEILKREKQFFQTLIASPDSSASTYRAAHYAANNDQKRA